MYSSRVIELQNQLEMVMATSKQPTAQHDQQATLQQINDLTKQVATLKQQNTDKQAKLDHQAVTIDKLIT